MMGAGRHPIKSMIVYRPHADCQCRSLHGQVFTARSQGCSPSAFQNAECQFGNERFAVTFIQPSRYRSNGSDFQFTVAERKGDRKRDDFILHDDCKRISDGFIIFRRINCILGPMRIKTLNHRQIAMPIQLPCFVQWIADQRIRRLQTIVDVLITAEYASKSLLTNV